MKEWESVYDKMVKAYMETDLDRAKAAAKKLVSMPGVPPKQVKEAKEILTEEMSLSASDNAAFDVHQTDPARLAKEDVGHGYNSYVDSGGKIMIVTPAGDERGPFRSKEDALKYFHLRIEAIKDMKSLIDK